MLTAVPVQTTTKNVPSMLKGDARTVRPTIVLHLCSNVIRTEPTKCLQQCDDLAIAGLDVGANNNNNNNNNNRTVFLVLAFSVSSRTRHQNFTNTWSKIISSHKIDRSDLPGHVTRGRKSIVFSTFSQIRFCAHKIQPEHIRRLGGIIRHNSKIVDGDACQVYINMHSIVLYCIVLSSH